MTSDTLIWADRARRTVHVGTDAGTSEYVFDTDIQLEPVPGWSGALVVEVAGPRRWLLNSKTSEMRAIDDPRLVGADLVSVGPAIVATRAESATSLGYVYALEDGTVYPVAAPPGVAPLVSPSGRILIHLRARDSSQVVDLVDRGSGQRVLSWETEPGWHLDGNGVVFSSDEEMVAAPTVATSGGLRAVTIFNLDSGSAADSLPTRWRFSYWLTDGTWLATNDATWRRFTNQDGLSEMGGFEEEEDGFCTSGPGERQLLTDAAGAPAAIVDVPAAQLWPISEGVEVTAPFSVGPVGNSSVVVAADSLKHKLTVLFLDDGRCIDVAAEGQSSGAAIPPIVGTNAALIQRRHGTVLLVRSDDKTNPIELAGTAEGASWSSDGELLYLPSDSGSIVIDSLGTEVQSIPASSAVWALS